jgi:CRISPR-associated protein Cmr4
VESSLGVGSGEEGLEADIPIQREVATGYPLVPGSTLKGVLRGRAQAQQAAPEYVRLLGSASEGDEKQPSTVVVSDALPLLFPVRSLTGLFAWTTSLEVWSRFQRDVAAYAVKLPLPALPTLPAETAGVAPGSPLVTSKQSLVLEELSFPIQAGAPVAELGAWVAEHAVPDGAHFDYWRQQLPARLAILPEGAYRYFVEHGTQVTPHIRIDKTTGTAAEGALWTEEYLPPETLLAALLGANLPAIPEGSTDTLPSKIKKAGDILDWLKGLAPVSLQMGGGQTTGHGLVWVRWTGKKIARARRASKAK